jgi:3-methylfumaryl-CoA hydratase
MTNASDDFSSWIGRTEIVEDDISPATAQAAAATFDEDLEQFKAGVNLPPLWHWFYFLPKASQSKLGVDGHPQRETGSFMPPIPLPRRMFAGARLTWHRPLLVGRLARREAEILDVRRKSGRSGELAFVTVAYRYFQEKRVVGTLRVPTDPHTECAGYYEGHDEGLDLCIEEEQDIVYREPGAPLPPPEVVELPDVPDGAWAQAVMPDTRLLLRFSALTFNAHRIHYDRPYATSEEGYPGLVVHGPLTAMLLLKLVRENTGQAIASFSFRSQMPLFDLAPFRLVGLLENGCVELQAQGPDAKKAMVATAELAK